MNKDMEACEPARDLRIESLEQEARRIANLASEITEFVADTTGRIAGPYPPCEAAQKAVQQGFNFDGIYSRIHEQIKRVESYLETIRGETYRL